MPASRFRSFFSRQHEGASQQLRRHARRHHRTALDIRIGQFCRCHVRPAAPQTSCEQRQYIAAINRFNVVVTQYQDTRHVEEALERLVEANLAMGLVREAQTAAAVLGHNFPNSRWYKDAYALLQKKGVSPENFGGPVGEAFNGKQAT